jgi:hypothetical protein
MHRVLRPGGVCAVTSVMWFPIHAYPHDYWRFTPEGLLLLLSPFDYLWARGVGHPLLPTQVVAVAAKDRDLGLTEESFTTLSKLQDNWRRAPGRVRLGPVHVSPGELLRAAARDLPRAAAQRAATRLRSSR